LLSGCRVSHVLKLWSKL